MQEGRKRGRERGWTHESSEGAAENCGDGGEIETVWRSVGITVECSTRGGEDVHGPDGPVRGEEGLDAGGLPINGGVEGKRRRGLTALI
jgi:hypothetical protein